MKPLTTGNQRWPNGLLRGLRHWVEYGLALLVREPFRRLSPDRAVAFGAALGTAYARLRGPRTREAEINLGLALPDWSDGRRHRVLVDSFANLGRCLAEVFLLQGSRRQALLEGLTVEGLEHYDTAKQASASGGVIVLTAHFGSWELCGAAMAQRGYPLSVVHHGFANPYLDRMVSRWRRASGVEEIRMGGAAMGVFRALSKGRLVALLLDQSAHRDEGVFAPFFGEQALTRSAPARLAAGRGVPVLPVFIFRVGRTSRHVVKVYPPLELESASADSDSEAVRNVARMNQAIETAVRSAPDHWLWPHRRFKNRPDGVPPLYPRSRRRQRRRDRA